MKYILITCHRREHLEEKKKNLHDAIKQLSKIGAVIKYISHPNYKIPAWVSRIKNVEVLEPVEHGRFYELLKGCYFVLTDSGGLQEECAIIGKPCLVMRDTTERPESIMAGCAKLIGWNSENIAMNCADLISNADARSKMINTDKNIYGAPGAGKRIYECIRTFCKKL